MAFETMAFDVNDVNADEWDVRALNIIGQYGFKFSIASEDLKYKHYVYGAFYYVFLCFLQLDKWSL